MNEIEKNTGFFNSAHNLTRKFGPAEKMIFGVFSALLIIFGLNLLIRVNNLFLVEVPAKGGVLREGFVGAPRFINPILAVSDTDKSLSELVYSSIADSAEDIRVSDDGLVYDVNLKPKVVFQDGKPVTADDILFTIDMALDPVIKSPKAGSWAGVTTEKVSDTQVRFTLKKPYSPFTENFNLGILPKHLWQEVTPEEFAFSSQNINPVGSGPYKISSVSRNGNSTPTEIDLKPFSKYIKGEPKIGEIDILFYPSESASAEAYSSGSVDAVGGLSPENALALGSSGANITTASMSRIFGVFFNQNQASLFANIEVRKALDASLDKEAIVGEITRGFGTALSGPTPFDIWVSAANTTTSTSTEWRLENAKNILTKAGWTANKDGVLEKKTKKETFTLKFSISTSDVPDLKKTGEILRDTWAKLGAEVELKVFESGDLNQNVIRPRKYDALLFGEIVDKSLDLYPFWHSSERIDPGLNIALYTNVKADKLLEDIRIAKTPEERDSDIELFENEVKNDIPAVFLYSPKYIYGISKEVKNVTIPEPVNPQNRYSSIGDWYIKTKKVWKILAN
jgi:peptide/nickel transport system substrate-binding protein